jgi:hypothetical protein
MSDTVSDSVDIFTETQARQTLLASAAASAIDLATNGSDRSRQSKANVVGVSDVGGCREYVRRVVIDEEPTQEVHTYDLAAFIGSAVGDKMEDAWIDWHDQREPGVEWHKQGEVTVTLTVRGMVLNIPGHPDLYSRHDLVDFKTVDGLGVVRRTGPTDQQRYQRALYFKALLDAGKVDPDGWVHNVYIDRSGSDSNPVVWSAPYDPREVEEAVEWLSDVIYAIQMGEEASRDKPREFCYACCPFAPACRGEDDSDVEGLIDDPFILEAIEVYNAAKDAIKLAEKDKQSAASVLADVNGRTPSHIVRWVNIGPSDVAYTRAGYRRLDVKPIPLKKQPKRTKGDNVAADGGNEVPEPGSQDGAGERTEVGQVPAGE